MGKENILVLSRIIFASLIISIILFIVSYVIGNTEILTYKDILFIEGIISIIIGALTTIGVSNIGLYFKARNSSNTQFTSTDREGNIKYERDMENVKKVLPFSIIRVGLITGGIIACILSFII